MKAATAAVHFIMSCNLPSRLPARCSSFRLNDSRRYLSTTPRAAADRPEVTVVGGGAAGLTAAFFASESGAEVTVLERTREAGKKVLMSGGTRCNVLPVEMDLQRDFFTESPASALRSIFATWQLEEVRHWLEDPHDGIGLALAVEEETNKYFPASNSSRDVRDALVAACERRGVRFRYNASVEGIQQLPGEAGYRCSLAGGSDVCSPRLVVATGGLSFPAVGTDGTGHRLLRGLGHSLKQLYPALTPLLGPHPGGQQLAGLSLYEVLMECQTSKNKKTARQALRSGLLFTHKGYSGPSVLDLSHHAVMALERKAEQRPPIRVNWTGESRGSWEDRLAGAGVVQVANLLQRYGVKERLADALCGQLGIAGKRVCDLKRPEKEALLEALVAYPLQYTGHEGYKKAEVTGGGIPLTEVDCRNLESRLLPGLFMCGEVMDVFGRIGGFNFLWAWISGRLAGLGAAGAVAGSAARLQPAAGKSETAGQGTKYVK